MDTIDRQSVILALLGAEAAVAALMLVYQGFLLSALSAIGNQGSAAVKRPYRQAVLAALAVFIVADVTALGALGWLLGVDLFWVVVGASVLSLVTLLAMAIWTTMLLMRG